MLLEAGSVCGALDILEAFVTRRLVALREQFLVRW